MKNPQARFSLSLLYSLAFISLAAADCGCGYSIVTGDDHKTVVFANVFESDFVHTNYAGADSSQKGWRTQVFNMDATAARGLYGESFVASNVNSNLIEDVKIWTGEGADGGAAGLEVAVDSNIVDAMVQSGQIATTEGDYFYGSYRASMKITAVEGTCSAFFWYFNDTQEIDLEFLSGEFDASTSTYPVNLVLQTSESKAAGYDASKTGTFVKVNLSFDPTADFYEYRFDFLSSRVLFYADNVLLASMNDSTGAVPTTPGNLILSHWSNGNSAWSRGPPNSRATSVVRYVKAYYNSSSDGRDSALEKSTCTDPAAQGSVCEVPEGNATFFFMYQGNMTGNGGNDDDDNNQNGHKNETISMRTRIGSTMALCVALTTFMCGFVLWM